MIVLVYEDQIAGTSDTLENLPMGFSAYSVPKAPLEDLYFDGVSVVPKPPKPDPSAYWVRDHWVTDVSVSPEAQEPFTASPLFQVAWAASQSDPALLALFCTALYADVKGDIALLEYTKTQLEDKLSDPATALS